MYSFASLTKLGSAGLSAIARFALSLIKLWEDSRTEAQKADDERRYGVNSLYMAVWREKAKKDLF